MKLINRLVHCLTVLGFGLSLSAQMPKQPNSAEIYEQIKKLNVLASAMYVAAHPDDENQRLISYLSNEIKANTVYLSLTRGDGGQNIAGSEIKEQLGIIRTQELLAARKTDGGTQTFSRAIDFGYSKHPDETLRIWNKDEVLSDVIWAIRKYQPDIIINRFDHRSPGKTHGHHTSSAMLSFEAFDMTANKKVEREQLDLVDTWQPKRLFFNTSWWFYGGRDKFAKADKSNLLGVDVGVYYPTLGTSNNEIAARARSMHKSQGFGATGSRGSQTEYLEILKGDMPSNREDIFEGIDITWGRVKGGQAIRNLVDQVINNYNLSKPSESIEGLVAVKTAIENLKPSFWKSKKLEEVENIIYNCLGLYVEAVVNQELATDGEEIEVSLEVVSRADVPVKWIDYKAHPFDQDTLINSDLVRNEKSAYFFKYKVSQDNDTRPYWLKSKGTLGMYDVKEQDKIGVPKLASEYRADFNFEIYGSKFSISKDFVYKENDRIKGEIYKPFYVVPAVSCSIENPIYIYKDDNAQEVSVHVKSFAENVSGKVVLCTPKNWKISPESYDFNLEQKGEETSYKFQLTPPKNESDGLIGPIVTVGEKSYTETVFVIDYEYIPQQISVENSESRVVKSNIRIAGEKVAYIMGAGDKVPEALEQMGYQVSTIGVDAIRSGSLDKYDAVILGIRAYNTEKELKLKQKHLFEYVSNGGTLIVQYMTTWGLDVEEMGPLHIKPGRDRVTDELAKPTFTNPDHPVLNWPNKITQKDFEGWTTERGLYFASEWDKAFQTPISWNDPGEDPKSGGLLIAPYEKGHFVYTGISWFRQLPAGVPGAYKLFANLVSIGKEADRP